MGNIVIKPSFSNACDFFWWFSWSSNQ
jgi:hypothetical protein